MRRGIAASVLIFALALAYWFFQRSEESTSPTGTEAPLAVKHPLLEAARGMLAAHRQIIVLLAEEKPSRHRSGRRRNGLATPCSTTIWRA